MYTRFLFCLHQFRSSADEVYISGVSCNCLTCSLNSVASAGAGRNGTPPIGVAAFASQSRKSDRYRHRPRSYSALGDPAAESRIG
jgi:hypothetical protein